MDAFNPLTDWYDTDVIGIDTGITMLMAENARRLLARFPEYSRLVQDFIAADPLREIREAAWARLNSAPRPFLPEDTPRVLLGIDGGGDGQEESGSEYTG